MIKILLKPNRVSSKPHLADFKAIRLEVQGKAFRWEGEVVVLKESLSIVFLAVLYKPKVIGYKRGFRREP
jgi:hypothetical protein